MTFREENGYIHTECILRTTTSNVKFRRAVAAYSGCVKAVGDLDHACRDLVHGVRMDERREKRLTKSKELRTRPRKIPTCRGGKWKEEPKERKRLI